jgi:hypothetical protein
MATPHVAGAWALLKQKTPSASVSSLLASLQSTGTPVTDTRVTGGFTKPRINIADAAGVPIARPVNDAFASAQALTGANATVTGANVNATKESGEPNHAGNTGGKSVWYKWTPQASGTTTIDTAGSNFDTLLAVYSGSAVNSLTPVASNDDDPNGGFQSKVSFTANAGTTYQIAVDGYGAAFGNINLRLASTSTDTTPPKVKSSTIPANSATGIAPGVNVTAPFSEAMDASTTDGDPSTINGTTFKLMRAGTTTAIGAVVSYDATAKKATLNPNANLQLGTKYKAVVTTGAQDLAGNQLDQNSSLGGLQQKTWTFTIRN